MGNRFGATSLNPKQAKTIWQTHMLQSSGVSHVEDESAQVLHAWTDAYYLGTLPPWLDKLADLYVLSVTSEVASQIQERKSGVESQKVEEPIGGQVDLKARFKRDRGTYKPGVHARFYLFGWRDTSRKLWRLSQLCKVFSSPFSNRRLFLAQPVWREVAFNLMQRTVDQACVGWKEVYFATTGGTTMELPTPPIDAPSTHGPFQCALSCCGYSTSSVIALRDHLELHTEPEEPGGWLDRPGYCTCCAVGCQLITVCGRFYNQTQPFLQLCSQCGNLATVLLVYHLNQEGNLLPHVLISGTQVGAIVAQAREGGGDRKHGGVEHRWFPNHEENDWAINGFVYFCPLLNSETQANLLPLHQATRHGSADTHKQPFGE